MDLGSETNPLSRQAISTAIAKEKVAILLEQNKLKMVELAKAKAQRERELAEIEEKIAAVQRSTKTLLPQFTRLHNYFRMQWPWYYRWAANPYSSKVHGVSLAIFIVGLLLLFITTTIGRPNPSSAQESLPIAATSSESILDKEVNLPSNFIYELVADPEGRRIRTKAATDAGYQEVLISANSQKLYDGFKLAAVSTMSVEEEKDGVWQAVGEKINQDANLLPTVLSSNDAAGVAESASPVESKSTPVAATDNFAKKLSNISILEQVAEKLEIQTETELTNNAKLLMNFQVTPSGQHYNYQIAASGAKQRFVWEIQLKNFDLTADKTEIPIGNKAEYGNVIIDLSSFLGQIRWEEKADTDTIKIYFPSAASDQDLLSETVLKIK